MTSNAQPRQRFAKELSTFCQTNGFKGMLYDWEFPRTPQEEVVFDHLLRETGRLFVPKRRTVPDRNYDIGQLIGIMIFTLCWPC